MRYDEIFNYNSISCLSDVSALENVKTGQRVAKLRARFVSCVCRGTFLLNDGKLARDLTSVVHGAQLRRRSKIDMPSPVCSKRILALLELQNGR